MTLSCDNILAPEWDDQVFDPYTSMNTGSHQKARFRFPDSYWEFVTYLEMSHQ